jgi:hypothetical protein
VLPLIVVLQLLLPVGLQAAAPDPCPEPNSTIDRACFLGPGGPTSGYLEAADDVDTYVLELPAASALEATLSAPTDDDAIRLLGSEGAVRAVAEGSGTTNQLRQDGLPAGKYYLSVFSPGGAISAADPYVGEYNATLSPDRVTIVWHSVFVANYGEGAALATVVANQRSELAKICKVEPTQGWGSEQVYSCSNKFGPVFIRASVRKHRNVEAELVVAGLEQYATWDHIAGLMAKVEGQIWDALK